MKREDEAIQLIAVALERKNLGDDKWTDTLLQGGQLLSQSTDKQLLLLAAAALKLAGCSHQVSELIPRITTTPGMICSFLQADFPQLRRAIVEYWSSEIASNIAAKINLSPSQSDAFFDNLQQELLRETVRCLGILAAAQRWGKNSRFATAMKKLNQLSQVMAYTDKPSSWLFAQLFVEIARIYAAEISDVSPPRPSGSAKSLEFPIKLLRDFRLAPGDYWRVLPVEVGRKIYWIDPAGFPFAVCPHRDNCPDNLLEDYDFVLEAEREIVWGEKRIRLNNKTTLK